MKTIVSTLSVVLVVSVLARVAIAGQGYTFTTIDISGALALSANGINDKQEIVGSYFDAGVHGFRLDKHGTLTTLDVPGVTFAEAFAINGEGQIVGRSLGSGVSQGWYYDRNLFLLPDPPEGTDFLVARGINDRQEIVGWYRNTTGRHGFLYADGGFTTIDSPYPGAADTEVTGINTHGAVVGFSFTTTPLRTGFLREPDGTFAAILVPGAGITLPYGLNDQGVIVGTYRNPQGTYGFLYDRETYTTIEVPGSFGTEIYGINNHGRLVGIYRDAQGNQHGFVAK